MPPLDYTLPTIKTDDFPTVETMGEVKEFLINTTDGKSKAIAKGNVQFPASQITDIQDIVDDLQAISDEISAEIEGEAEAVIAAASVFGTTHPETGLYTRITADSATQWDTDSAMQAFEKLKASDPTTVFTFMPHLASKIRTSGVNRYMNKMYSVKSATYDAVQATDAVQPFATLNAAPNSKVGVEFVAGQTQTGLLYFTDKVYAATDSWTFTLCLTINKKSVSTPVLLSLGGSASLYIYSNTFNITVPGLQPLVATHSLEIGKRNIIEFQYSNGTGLVKVNNVPAPTVAVSAAITFGQLSYSSTYPFDGTYYYSHLRDGVKSAYQSNLDYTVLRGFFPEIEGINIVNQHWATSNFRGVVAGDGTAIPEVQGATTAANAELISDTNLDTWTKDASVTSASTLTFTTNASGGVSKTTYISNGKANRTILVGTSNVAWSLYDGTTKIVDISSGAFDLTSTPAYWKYTTSLRILLSGAGTITFTSMSNKEAGAADATNIYNYVYAATSGTTAVKDLAATKAAAMWKHHGNDVTRGALYGKLYNGYAVKLFTLYTPIRGYRIGSDLDWLQLQTVSGGQSIAGGKLKHNGVTYFSSPNVGATNEFGMTILPSGSISSAGADVNLNYPRFWTSTSGTRVAFEVDSTNMYLQTGQDMREMYAIRLLRNEPATPTTSEKTTGYITNNIASAAYDFTGIPFGNRIDALRIVSDTAMTGFQAVLYTGAGVAKETLCTGIAITSGQPIVIPITVAQSIQLTDCTIRVTATTKTDTAGRFMVNALLANAYTNQI